MRTAGKFGLAGLALTALMGCGSKGTMDPIDGLKLVRRMRTAEGAQEFSEGLKSVNKQAVKDYTAHAKAKEAEDLKPLDTAEEEMNKLAKLTDSFYESLRELKGLPSKEEEKDAPKDTATEIYGISEERQDINTYHFGGVGFRLEKVRGRGVYSFGGEFASSEKTGGDLTTRINYTSDKQEVYGSAEIRLINTKPFKLDLGLKGMFRWQEDVIETSNALGDSTWKDTTSIPGVALEAGLQIGKFIIRAEHSEYFGGEGSHQDLKTDSIKLGVKF